MQKRNTNLTKKRMSMTNLQHLLVRSVNTKIIVKEYTLKSLW